jgi:prolyl-tRNA editing enzyme YbaK/EbsC (Cys-tRNA(Pro) deacylase)
MMQPLTPADVQAYLDKMGWGTPIRFFDTTTATSQQAADNIGCELGQIVKSICFLVKEQPVTVLTSGAQRVDDRKLAALFDVSRKQVSIAQGDELIAVWGYPAGSVPPFAYRTAGVRQFIDDSLKQYTQLYAAGGAHNAIFPITLDQLIAATSAPLVDIIRRDSPPAAS